jgi:hypothetical protein
MTIFRKRRRAGPENIVWSRLLVLQSKRLLLSGALRRVRRTGARADRRWADRLRTDADHAEDAYRASQATYGSARPPAYWVAVCRRMIDQGEAAAARLKAEAPGLSAGERFERATDLQMLEELVDQWRVSANRGMR